MRKILLASVGALGAASWGGLAFAQSPGGAANQGQIVSSPTPFGIASAFTNNNSNVAMTPPGAGTAPGGQIAMYPGFIANPTPGTIVIHLGGKVDAEIQANFTSLDRGVTAAAPNGATFSTNKVQPIGIGSFMRIYPGVDGMAANGLRYGASVEIRQNFKSANNYAVSVTSATAANTIGTTAASASGNSSAQTLFVRRAFTYLAGDQWGLLRFGTTDGVLGLFDSGLFTSQTFDFGVGQLNGGASEAMMPGNVPGTFVWLSQAGAEYDNAKVVYLTPQFFGFDFGVQYAPSMGNAYTESLAGSPYQAAPCSSAATGGCVLQSSSALDGSRWMNQVAVGVRYQGSFNGFDPKFYALWETAGKEDYTGPAAPFGPTGSGTARKFDNLNFYSFGAVASYAGFTVSADYIGGAINNQLSMRPTGGASMSAPLVGMKYTSGPLTVGFSLATATFQGTAQMAGVSQRHANYLSAGGYYVIAPGMAVVAEYQYLTQHQGGVNLATGSTTTLANQFNNIKGQGFLLATVVNW